MAKWDLFVYNPDGSFRTVLTPDGDAVDEIRWAVRGDGDCLEALVTGVNLDLRPRDIVAIRSVSNAEEADSESVIRYWGWVVTAGDSRTHEVSETRLIGGSQRLREIVNQRLAIPGRDIGLMARLALEQTPNVLDLGLPPGLIGYEGAGQEWRFPLQGFELGVRYPHLEYISDTLEALAAAAPAFIAPAGGYTIDGVTYDQGEAVPATTWGTLAPATHDLPPRPGGRIYLRRASGTLELDEVLDELWVEWESVSADVVVDNVVAVVADRPSDGATEVRTGLITAESAYEPLMVVLEDQFADPYGAWQRVEVQTLDAFQASSWVGAPYSTIGVVNVNSAFDANPASYANNAAGAVMQFGRRCQAATRLVKVTYSSFRDLYVHVHLVPGDFVINGGEVKYKWRLAATNGEQRQVVLVAPSVEGANTGRVDVGVFCAGTLDMKDMSNSDLLLADEVRIHDITAMKLNTEVLERIARAELRPPAIEAGSVTIPHQLVSPQPRVELTLEDATVVTAAGAVYEYAITREGGFSTTVRLNQELPADLTSERELLRRRLRGSPNWGRGQ